MMARDKIEIQLRKLAIKEGLSLGILFSSSRADFDLLATSAALCLPKVGRSSEKAVNELLKQWLFGAGRMLNVDHVELRRWLADLDLVRRDAAGAEYRQNIVAEPYVSLAEALQDVDAARIVRESIQQHQAERVARKAAWHAKANP